MGSDAPPGNGGMRYHWIDVSSYTNYRQTADLIKIDGGRDTYRWYRCSVPCVLRALKVREMLYRELETWKAVFASKSCMLGSHPSVIANDYLPYLHHNAVAFAGGQSHNQNTIFT